MNRYGRLAMSHWRQWVPQRYAQLPDPQEFFSTLGQEVQDRVQELMQGLPPSRLDYLRKVGQLNMARLTAEEQALREMVYAPVEDSESSEQEDSLRLVREVQQALDLAYRQDADSQD